MGSAMERFLRVIVATLLVGVVFVYPMAAPPQHRIDGRHFDLVREGMTYADAEAIFGVPAGVYDWAMISNEDPKWQIVFLIQPDNNACIPVQIERQPDTVKLWLSRHGAFGVSIDRDTRVKPFRLPGTPMTDPPWKKWWYKLRNH